MFTLVVRVDANASDGSTVVDTASVSTSESTDNDPDNDGDTATTTVVAATVPVAKADLAVTQSASPGTAIVGTDSITFTVKVTNRGPTAGTNVTLIELLPAGAAFVTATGGATPVDGTLRFPLGDLATGASRTFAIIVRPLAAGTLTATATVSATETDPATGNNTAKASAVAAAPTTTPAGGPDGPRIVAVRRYGVHMMPTTVVVSFDGPLATGPARNVDNYRITGPNGARIAVQSAVYDPVAHTVTVHAARRISIHRPYKLVIRGTGPDGISDTAIRMLDGQGTGQPGSDYATTLTWRNLVLPAWYQTARNSVSRGR